MKKNKMKNLEKSTISKEKQADVKGQEGLAGICAACGAAAVQGFCSNPNCNNFNLDKFTHGYQIWF